MPESQLQQMTSEGSPRCGGASLVHIYRISSFILITLSLFFLCAVTLSDSLSSFSMYTLSNVTRWKNINWWVRINNISSTSDDNAIHANSADKRDFVQNKNISILFFSYGKGNTQTNYKSECKLQYNCVFTHDGYFGAQKWVHYSAVMIYGFPGIKRFHQQFRSTQFQRDPKQLWIAKGMESSRSGLDFGSRTPLKTLFNLTVAASPKASITDSYMTVFKSDRPKTKSKIEQEYRKIEKSRSFCWMVSQCNVYNDRFTLAAKIINNLPDKIHMWGRAASRCMPLAIKSQIIDHGSTQKFIPITTDDEIRKCKFYFAFENSNCSDYITEKFPNALANYAVPIVNGWRESYAQRLPGSFIHVADFESPARLAEYLKFLLNNESAYFEYHYWRTKYELARSQESIPWHNRLACKICDKVHQFNKANSKEIIVSEKVRDLGETFRNMQQCVPR